MFPSPCHLTSVLWRRGLCELVKYVEVSLVHNLAYYSRLLQQIVVDVCSHRLSLAVEVDLEIFSESRGVVVPQRLRVSKGLEQRVRGQHHVLGLLNR
jgi:hypothetical protein